VSVLLFTGGGGAGTEALFRLLRHSHDVHFADADVDAKPATIPSSRWHVIPMASAPEFVGDLGGLCRSLQVDVLVPGVDEELLPISRARATFSGEVMSPPEAFVATHLDKLESSRALASAGVRVPETEWLPRRERVGFPCVVKPQRGRGSRDVAIMRSVDELRAHLVHCRRPAEDFIVQQYLEGQEYTVTVVADRTGGLRAVVPVKVARKKGITLRAVTDHNDAVIAACVRIHEASAASGCFNVQMIAHASGVVEPFEINPRISTTTCLAMAAGVDIVSLFLGAQAQLVDAQGLAAFRNQVQLRRSWVNEFSDAITGTVISC
jgi:carbamoyl-phosphate synthase large subunit